MIYIHLHLLMWDHTRWLAAELVFEAREAIHLTNHDMVYMCVNFLHLFYTCVYIYIYKFKYNI